MIHEAMQANGMRMRELGDGDAVAAELGIDFTEARTACVEAAHEWARLVPAAPTIRDLLDAVSSAEYAGILAGVRVGKMLTPTRLDDDTLNELSRCANRLNDLAQRHDDETLDPVPLWAGEVRAVAGILDRVCAQGRA